MSIKELRQHIDALPKLAHNRRISIAELVNQNKENGFSDLDGKLFLLAQDWAINPDLRAVAKKHKLTKEEVKELIGSPLVHAAMMHCRNIYKQHSIVDAAWIENKRLMALEMAMGNEEINMIDRNGMQIEGKDTNLTVARGFLNDLEKTKSQENGIDSRPMINIVNNGGTVNMNNEDFFAQFNKEQNASLGSVEEGEYEELHND
ncbi:hypothetical protein [Vibrio coralliilyticus]|uniref:hypothetical protein n=1 Tax=Vibrio coralliilyticus TaxID=190893 RepID=UPI001E516315|nr:hypothetical protein [Vibrio coralliilyticus]